MKAGSVRAFAGVDSDHESVVGWPLCARAASSTAAQACHSPHNRGHGRAMRNQPQRIEQLSTIGRAVRRPRCCHRTEDAPNECTSWDGTHPHTGEARLDRSTQRPPTTSNEVRRGGARAWAGEMRRGPQPTHTCDTQTARHLASSLRRTLSTHSLVVSLSHQ